jgi:HEAT repeat protein
MKDPRAADALSKAIDGDRAIHMKASYLWALAALGGDTAKTRLETFVSSEDRTLRACATAGLARMLGTDAVPVLREALKDENKHISGFARRKLAALGDESVLTEYIATANDRKQSFGARAAAIGVLADCGYRRAVPDLVKLLVDQEKQGKNDTVAAHAALALYRLGDERGVAYLKSALMSGTDKAKKHVAQSAASALGSVEEKKAVPILMAGLLLKKMWWEVKPTIVNFLFKATGIDPAGEVQYLNWNRFYRDAECWQKWWEENKPRYAE